MKPSSKSPSSVNRATPKQAVAQQQKFIDKARELGCDDDEAAFDDKLRRVAKQKPKEDSDEK